MIDRLEVPAGSPARALRPVRDMAGLSVKDASGLHVGSIWGALADEETGLIRYLDMSLTDEPRHVLVPIGHARIYDYHEETEVKLRAALLEELQEIPPFNPEASVDDAIEREVLEAHGRLFHGERYYAHPSFDHRGLYAGAHPIAREAASAPGADTALRPLRELRGYRLARGEPDVRGWNVVGAVGALGTISDLIVDPAAEQVRYVVVEHDGERVLLPIGFLRLDVDAERVRAPGVLPADIEHLPRYQGGAVERATEEATRSALMQQFDGARRYQLPDFTPARD
jgi:hypothetical protein